MDNLAEVMKHSASPTMDTDAVHQTGMFCMELQTCVITAEGREIHLMKVNNVVAFSCKCLQCGKDISAKSLLESHLRTHPNTEKNVSETDSCVLVDRIAGEDEGDTPGNDISDNHHDHSILDEDETMDEESEVNSNDHSEIDTIDDGQQSSGSAMSKIPPKADSNTAKPVLIDEDTPGIDTHTVHKPVSKPCQASPKLKDQARSDMKDNSEPTCTSLTGKQTDKLIAKSRRQSKRKKLVGEELMEEHRWGKPHVCTICGNSYNRGCELGAHLKWHKKDEPRCQECGKLFARPFQLQRHLLVHTGEKNHSCAICGKHFRLESQVKTHMVTHKQEKPYKCSLCGKAFARKSAITQHLNVHKKGRSFMCSICGKTFRIPTTLKKHVEVIHEEKHYTCEICGQVLRSQSTFRDHCKRHSDEKPHLCSECGKRFTRKCDLTSHVRTHTGDKPYSCSVCGKMFNQKCYLEEHVRIHTGEKPLKCTKCDLAFRMRSSYRRHVKKDHQEVEQYEEVTVKASSADLLENISTADIDSAIMLVGLTDELTNMK